MKYLRRLVGFLFTRLLALLCILGLLVTVFYFSMNATNIYIIAKDGMAQRAQMIITGEAERLEAYFLENSAERDTELREALNGNSAYQRYYNIPSFDYQLSLDWFWCWPWEDSARATVTERVSLPDGKLNSASRVEAEAQGLPNTPVWQSRTYSLYLERKNGQWQIKNVSVSRMVRDE